MQSGESGAASNAAARPARLLVLTEADIPSAVLGLHSVLDSLAATGHCELRKGTSVSARANDLAWCDALLLVRGASPAELRIAREAQRLGRRVATYLDDDLENVPADARSAYFFRSAVVSAGVASIIREADLVLVCNPLLGEELTRRHGVATTLLLQPVPSPDPEGEPVAVTAEPNLARRLRIGFLGSVDHAGFLDELLGEALRRLDFQQGHAIDFVFCGAKPQLVAALGASWHPFDPDFRRWRQTAAGLRLDIGLAPLRESSFHRFKYWNKYLEYGSLGIAGIYSAGSPNAQIVRDGETGLICPNEPEAWLDALRRLIDEPTLRQRLGEAARVDVGQRFSENALRNGWLTGLEPILRHRAPEIPRREVRLSTGRLRHLRDRLAVYGPLRFIERLAGRLTGRLRPG